MKDTLVAGEYKYCLKNCLGQGAWGSVYKATNKQNKKVALKKMNKFQIEASIQNYHKLESEIKLLKQVKDSNYIIKFIDVFRTESNYYIITEYIEGSEDLYKYIQRTKISFMEIEAIGLWRKLLKGVEYLHEKGIMHRDLKLQNIIYVEDLKDIKIIDFGLAVTLDTQESKGVPVGSPLFMSPQVLKKQKYTNKCDIWSLGIVFYYMLFCRSPYGDPKSIKQIESSVQKIKINKFKFTNEVISKNAKQVINACLQYNQQDRPQAKELLKYKLFTQNKTFLDQAKLLGNFTPVNGFLKPDHNLNQL